MNNGVKKPVMKLSGRFCFALALFVVLFGSASVHAQGKKNSKGESFYIIASVDRARSQVLLKMPSEVTMMMKVDNKTQYLDSTGKPLQLTDLRSGATVWVASTGGDQPTATRIELGAMTVPLLHQLYLDYPEIK